MVYGEASPYIIFGVLESMGRIMSDSHLKPFREHVSTFATEVENGKAKRIIYGCTVSLRAARSQKRSHEMQEVMKFAAQYGLGEPTIMLGLMGDYDVRLRTYEPIITKEEATAKDGESSKEVAKDVGQDDEASQEVGKSEKTEEKVTGVSKSEKAGGVEGH